MVKSIYRDIDNDRLNKFLELPHELGTVRYIVAPQGVFLTEMTTFKTLNAVKVHTARYVKQLIAKGIDVDVGVLAPISLLQVYYSDDDQSEALIKQTLSTGFCAHLKEYSLLELLYRETLFEGADKSLLMYLLGNVKGLKADHNEFMFFLKNLHS